MSLIIAAFIVALLCAGPAFGANGAEDDAAADRKPVPAEPPATQKKKPNADAAQPVKSGKVATAKKSPGSAKPAKASRSSKSSKSAKSAKAAKASKSAKSTKASRAPTAAESAAEAAAYAADLERYKVELARHVSAANPDAVHAQRPQALLRSVIVLRLRIDAQGNLVGSSIERSNQDAATEAAALASMRRAGPLPKPAARLVRRGPVELSETWLFNTDGRFQLRSIAQKQVDE